MPVQVTYPGVYVQSAAPEASNTDEEIGAGFHNAVRADRGRLKLDVRRQVRSRRSPCERGAA